MQSHGSGGSRSTITVLLSCNSRQTVDKYKVSLRSFCAGDARAAWRQPPHRRQQAEAARDRSILRRHRRQARRMAGRHRRLRPAVLQVRGIALAVTQCTDNSFVNVRVLGTLCPFRCKCFCIGLGHQLLRLLLMPVVVQLTSQSVCRTYELLLGLWLS